MDILTLAVLMLLPALAIVGGLHDLTTMKIPNWISGLIVLGFVPAALLTGLSLPAAGLHLAVGAAALLVGMALFALRIIGGGDAKLLAAAALWMGSAGAPVFLVWTALAGGLFCLGLILARRYFPLVAPAAPGWLASLMAPKGDIPYGVAIAAGVLLAYPASPLMAAFAGG